MPKKATTAGGTTKKTRSKAAKKKTSTGAKAKKKATKTTRKAARKPAAKPAAAAAPATGGRLRVRQVRSGIGHAATYRRTLKALGLRHHQDEVVVADNPSVRGMVHKVRHLVQVTAEEG